MRRRDVLALVAAGSLGGCAEVLSPSTGPSVSTKRTATTSAATTATDGRTIVGTGPRTTDETGPRTTGETGPRTTGETEPSDDTEPGDEPETADGDGDRPSTDGVPVEHERFELRRLPYAKLPQSGQAARVEKTCDTTIEELDDVPALNVIEVNGERGHMPLRTTRGILGLQSCYRLSGDERYLETAESKAEALLDAAIEENGALFFPYMVDMGGASIDKQAPWVSAIAQGPALSGFLRLAEHTGARRYRSAAEKTFESFRTLYRDTAGDEKWIAAIDDGYYWLEEYPHDPLGKVLNGYLIGVWGLYEYWVARGSDASRTMVEAALKTVADHLEAYRVPGEVSWYSLNRGYRGNEFYHSLHVHQLGQLYAISGDARFEEMRQQFVEDHPPIEI